MELHYTKVNPCGNITLLVWDPVARDVQPAAAAEMMKQCGGEQVGFLEKAALPGAEARLQMMGGEFCGNATISLAACLAREKGMTDGTIVLEVSGADGALPCHIETKQGCVFGTVSMPLPLEIQRDGEHPLVCFPGIMHQIAAPEDFPQDKTAEGYARAACRRLKSDAFGLLLWDGQSMRPCVYVAGTDSTVWERGCASGSAALGCVLSLKDGQEKHDIRQPGGCISVRCQWEEDRLRTLTVTSPVEIEETGTFVYE